MNEPESTVRGGEYARRGDYHRELDETWEFRPTYLAKMRAVRRYLDQAGVVLGRATKPVGDFSPTRPWT